MKKNYIGDLLAFDIMQVSEKEHLEVERIDLSYESMDALIRGDTGDVRHIDFGFVQWRGFTIRATDNLNGAKYRIVTASKANYKA